MPNSPRELAGPSSAEHELAVLDRSAVGEEAEHAWTLPRCRQVRPTRYVLSFPERLARAVVAAVGGATYETAHLLLPRFVRGSKLYEVTAKNLLRIAIELVGRVEGAASVEETTPNARELTVRKTAGNVVELGSIAAFGFSPLWLLAGASDVVHGSRVYLRSLVDELERAGVVAHDVEVASVDELLAVLEHGLGTTAGLIDIPPLELAELRRSLAELGRRPQELPSATELRRLYDGLRLEAALENRSLLEVSTGVGLAFLLSAKNLSRDHLAVPYREDWKPIGAEGFAGYAGRVSRPYARAVVAHFDPRRPTWTEKVMGRLSRDV